MKLPLDTKGLKMDLRREAIKNSLQQLKTEQLLRLLEKIRIDGDSILCDNGWYAPHENKWCAKAVALGVDKLGIQCKTNEEARALIQGVGEAYSLAGKEFLLNSTSGIAGQFYTTNRLGDLKEICLEIINERRENI